MVSLSKIFVSRCRGAVESGVDCCEIRSAGLRIGWESPREGENLSCLGRGLECRISEQKPEGPAIKAGGWVILGMAYPHKREPFKTCDSGLWFVFICP